MSQNEAMEVEATQEDPTTVTTRAPKAVTSGYKPEGWSITLPHNLAENLQDLITQFGEQMVYDNAFAQIIVGFQGAVRRMAEANKTDDEIREVMASWKPGMRLGLGGDPIQKTLANFGNLSPEQQAAFMKQLADIQAGTKA